MADHVLSGPDGAPGRGRPVAGAESSQDRDEPSPLLAEHVEQVLGIELASAVGPQDHGHALSLPDGPPGAARYGGRPSGDGIYVSLIRAFRRSNCPASR